MKDMRMYEFAFEGGEKDWVFASSIPEAKEIHLHYTGCGDHDNCTVKAIPQEELKNHLLLDLNEPMPEDWEDEEDEYIGGYKIKETFEEYVKNNHIPEFVATTEF